jgi:hypothetical protein
MKVDDPLITRRARTRIARRRGALSGLSLIVLGAWGALIPFIGPYFNFAYTPDQTWHWTSARGWLAVLPGAVTVLGGLLVLMSSRRSAAVLGSSLAALAGAWFIVGPTMATVLNIGDVGSPTGSTDGVRALETLAFFSGLGALIVFIAGTALGRLSVRSLADMHVARRSIEQEAELATADERAARERAAEPAQPIAADPAEPVAADPAEPVAADPVRPATATHSAPTVSDSPTR